MPDILLVTLNARYIHAAFGLRYLLANMGDLQPRTAILEFDINQRPLEIVEAILAHQPRIIGLGIYIWNVALSTEVVALIKRLSPQTLIILGGPEVSHETLGQPIIQLADHTITGEADTKFSQVCAQLLAGHTLPKILPADLPALDTLALPYDLYTDSDLSHRVLYVEASRGCPFTCEFCLSSLDVPVRAVPLPLFLDALQRLLDRGATQFKFVDRTFNLNLTSSRAILDFFLARWRPGLFIHFEMVPDRLPEPLREIIARFPPGALQFEVGIQTFDDATAKNISRRQNIPRLEDNLRYLRQRTGVHIHADLIAGLPGEDLPTFGRGFDRLLALGPQEIQVGILKRLRGTPIIRHDTEWAMTYAPQPPYEILQNRLIDFPTMQRLRRFARCWDLIGNSGHFPATLPLLWVANHTPTSSDAPPAVENPTPFTAILAFTDWLAARLGRLHSVPLATLAESLHTYLTTQRHLPPDLVSEALTRDWHRTPNRERLPFTQPPALTPASPAPKSAPARQQRHLIA